MVSSRSNPPYWPTDFSSSWLIAVKFPNLAVVREYEPKFIFILFWRSQMWALTSDSSSLLILLQVSSSLLTLDQEELLGFSLIIATPFCCLFLGGLALFVVATVFFPSRKIHIIALKFCSRSKLNFEGVSVISDHSFSKVAKNVGLLFWKLF